MKNLIFILTSIIFATAFAETGAPLSNITGRVLIKGVYHTVSTTGDNVIPDSINFDGKNYDVTSGSTYHAKAEIVVNGILTMITVSSFLFPDTWSWRKDTVWNDAETVCNPDSSYFLSMSKTPVGSGYIFYGNCF